MPKTNTNTTATKALPEIDGITLTPELISFIDQMQNDEDSGYESIRNDLADAVCFLGGILYQLDKGKETNEAYKHIESLSIIREHFNLFESK